jgi:hypothetical protein
VVQRGQGNYPAARTTTEKTLREAIELGIPEAQAMAYADLGVIYSVQGHRLEALESHYKAFRLTPDPMQRMRVLGDLALGLHEIGAYEPARLGFQIVVESNASVEVRTNAMLELMDLESGLGNRVAFERCRAAAEQYRSRMSPRMTVDYLYKFGVGLARFGQAVEVPPVRCLAGFPQACGSVFDCCAIDVRLSPDTVGSKSATLEVTATPGGNASADLAGVDIRDCGLHSPGIRAALEELTEGTLLVSIFGAPYLCPPAPFEATLLLEERLRKEGKRDQVNVVVSTPAPLTLPVAGPDASRYLADRLKERGVTVLTEHAVASIDRQDQTVEFDGGDSLEWQMLLAVPAAAPPPVGAKSQLAGSSGCSQPDRRTFATGAERVYAAGDCTLIPTATAQLPKAGVFAEAAGKISAANLAADLYGGDQVTFDGYGFCFLELPGKQVATVTGDFYAEPHPAVRLTPPDEASFRAKQQWEQERLTAWLG